MKKESIILKNKYFQLSLISFYYFLIQFVLCSFSVLDSLNVHFFIQFSLCVLARALQPTWRRLHAGGGSQRFGRAINFQIPTNVRAGIHPRLREFRSLNDRPFCQGYFISNSEPNSTSKSLMILTSPSASSINLELFLTVTP